MSEKNLTIYGLKLKSNKFLRLIRNLNDIIVTDVIVATGGIEATIVVDVVAKAVEVMANKKEKSKLTN